MSLLDRPIVWWCDWCLYPSFRRWTLVSSAFTMTGHKRCMYGASSLLSMPNPSVVVERIPA